MTETYGYDAFGTLTEIRSLNAEGVLAETETALSRFLYSGEQYDAVTGLYYLRARQYDTVAGRFTQEDTYLGDGRNLYVYVQNNPLKYVDSSGYCSKKELLEKINSPYIEMSNTALELYDPVAEQERKESWERTKQGAVSVIKGAAALTAGVIVTACMPATAPALLQTVVSTVSLTSAGMGLYDVSEGVQDVYYGLSGDANSQSVHPIKDYYFHGNQETYNKAEMMLQVGTALGGLGTLAFSPTITAGNVANYANMMEQGLDFFDAVEESSESGSKPLEISEVSTYFAGRPEFTGTNREKLLEAIQHPKLANIANELYRPDAIVGDGGTADKLIKEFYEGSSIHLQKAIERLKNLEDLANSRSLGLNDLDILEALINDLKRAISLFD